MRKLFVVACISVCGFSGCGSNSGPTSSNSGTTAAPTAVTVSPSSAAVPAGGSQGFTATVSPAGASQAVTWSVSGAGCTGNDCGTINSTGYYIAPTTIPNPAEVTVTATPTAGPTGTATVTITPITAVCSNPDDTKLKGQYAFEFSGFDGDGFEAAVGSFTADGNGNITAGTEDFSDPLGIGTNRAFTGTYWACSDNRGSMTIGSGGFSRTFPFALGFFASGVAGRGRFIELDGTDSRGSGFLAKQDPAAFSTAAVTGGYAFGFAGNGNGGTLVADGRFTAGGGSLSDGQVDVNNSGTVALNMPFSGTYSVAANGRGTATLTLTTGIAYTPLSHFSFYVVSAGELLFMETDPSGSYPAGSNSRVTGVALQQSGGPFAASSLHGTSVFNLTCPDPSLSSYAMVVGQETFDGSGGLSGTFDANRGGVITSNAAFAATYQVDPNGRGFVTAGAPVAGGPFYLVSPGKGFVISAGSSAEGGMFDPQTGGPFGNASLSGNYVLGTLASALDFSLVPVSGVLTADGAGALSGTSVSSAGAGQSFTGGYSAAASGRTTLTITPNAGSPSDWVYYTISPSKAVGIQVDPGATRAGVHTIEK